MTYFDSWNKITRWMKLPTNPKAITRQLKWIIIWITWPLNKYDSTNEHKFAWTIPWVLSHVPLVTSTDHIVALFCDFNTNVQVSGRSIQYTVCSVVSVTASMEWLPNKMRSVSDIAVEASTNMLMLLLMGRMPGERNSAKLSGMSPESIIRM